MDAWEELRDDECHSYPNSVGPLSDALYFHVTMVTQEIGKGVPRSQGDIERDRAASINGFAHRVIRSAMRQLREKLSSEGA